MRTLGALEVVNISVDDDGADDQVWCLLLGVW